MLNKTFHDWLLGCAALEPFLTTVDQTENALKKQSATELALRFFAFCNVRYQSGFDVHEYLDEALMRMATSDTFDMAAEKDIFDRTFNLMQDAMGDRAFKRWNGTIFHGKFLMSVFEVVAIGVAKNIAAIDALPSKSDFVENRCKALWANTTFQKNSGPGSVEPRG